MSKIVYRVYYDFNESAKSDPARVPLDADGIARALQQFPAGVESSLRDYDAGVTYEPEPDEADSIVAVIESNAPEEQVNAAVETCLSELDLCGARLQRV